jgi:hypothetical protein
MSPRARRFAAVTLGLLLGGAASLPAQAPGGFNVITAPPKVNVQDKEDVWTLNFQFKSPRVHTTDIPGRGRKTVYYVWYQVWNTTGQPRYFIPTFELLDQDGSRLLFRDQVLPKVQQEIVAKEGVPGFDDIKNSVTMFAQPVPVTKPDANPAYVTGVAIFPDVVEKAPNMTRFVIFVGGLSNGWDVSDQGMIRSKTLQLNFTRRADARIQDAQTIRFAPPHDWIYRVTGVKAPDAKPGDR